MKEAILMWKERITMYEKGSPCMRKDRHVWERILMRRDHIDETHNAKAKRSSWKKKTKSEDLNKLKRNYYEQEQDEAQKTKNLVQLYASKKTIRRMEYEYDMFHYSFRIRALFLFESVSNSNFSIYYVFLDIVCHPTCNKKNVTLTTFKNFVCFYCIYYYLAEQVGVVSLSTDSIPILV